MKRENRLKKIQDTIASVETKGKHVGKGKEINVESARCFIHKYEVVLLKDIEVNLTVHWIFCVTNLSLTFCVAQHASTLKRV